MLISEVNQGLGVVDQGHRLPGATSDTATTVGLPAGWADSWGGEAQVCIRLPNLSTQYRPVWLTSPSRDEARLDRSVGADLLLEGPVGSNQHQEHRKEFQPSDEHQEGQHHACRC